MNCHPSVGNIERFTPDTTGTYEIRIQTIKGEKVIAAYEPIVGWATIITSVRADAEGRTRITNDIEPVTIYDGYALTWRELSEILKAQDPDCCPDYELVNRSRPV